MAGLEFFKLLGLGLGPGPGIGAGSRINICTKNRDWFGYKLEGSLFITQGNKKKTKEHKISLRLFNQRNCVWFIACFKLLSKSLITLVSLRI